MAEKNLAQKLAAVLGGVHRVPKNGENRHHGYDFVKEDDLSDAVRPLLAEQGVIILPSVHSIEASGKAVTVYLEWTITDGNESYTVMGAGVGANGDKAVASAITSAQKYLLYKTFLFSTGDDPDYDNNTGNSPGSSKAKSKAGTKADPNAPTDAQRNEFSELVSRVADDTAELALEWIKTHNTRKDYADAIKQLEKAAA